MMRDMRRFLLLALAAFISACASGRGNDAGPTPTTGMSIVRVVYRFSHVPLAGVTILTTYGDQILSSGVTDANGETAVLVAVGGEITLIDPENIDITIFETAPDTEYLFSIVRFPQPTPATLNLSVSGPVGPDGFAGGSIPCQAFGTSEALVPKRPLCVTPENTMNVFARSTVGSDLYGAAALGIPVATTALTLVLAPVTDSLDVSATLPASWPSRMTAVVEARPLYDEFCGFGSATFDASTDFSHTIPLLATSASGFAISVQAQTPNENRALVVHSTTRTIDLTAELMDVPALPGTVTLVTSSVARFTFDETDANFATLLFAQADGLDWLGVLPPDATEAHIPPRMSPIPVPTVFTLGALSSPDALPHSEWWRSFVCSTRMAWAFDRIPTTF